ncbi:DNA replication and repair protein RecF [Dyella jiangningensis]|uniref:DNA replication/repair protein RecF n=1 Tax=Dyella sp. AtDHG13 TaxID=1938897 RepID=UPI000880A190|nr:DNA replication/repair protein RecF [Dyella sp. AtDHG13]PXV56952.1 DNA replication and repair protein RecF [Dyella sp. AtDHG13]SDK62036.1 DNA replication and repair protein RecF [Dyella jiangningensis]
MRLETMKIRGLRCLSEVTIPLEAGMTVFVGANGAGKTSVLEAAFLLSHARSFRSGAKDALLQRGAESLAVFAELRHQDDRIRRLGLGRQGVRWEARMDGDIVSLSELVGECAVVCFEPGSHALIAGGAEERRRYLDWGVFHVEQEFMPAWRRYQRALKQRNSLLRASAPASEALFLPWEAELDATASVIDRLRELYLVALRPHIERTMQGLLPELGSVELRYRRGWTDEVSLGAVLASQRGRDLARGHTTMGSHRADWALSFEHAPQREHLSRGQEKLAALGCMLAQAALYAERRGEWPVVCLDDLASELDKSHQAAVVEQLRSVGAQVLVTGTEVPDALQGGSARVFHVEQGHLSPLL